MKEVVKKEIIKQFDAKVIYLISDIEWVSPIQCVPKKASMNMVTNSNDKLIQMCKVTK